MKINFKLTRKDYWNYNHYSIMHIRNIRKIFIRTPIILFIICLFAGIYFKNWFVAVGMSLGLPAVYILTIYFPMTKGIRNIPNDKLVEHTVEIDVDKKQLIHSYGDKTRKCNTKNVIQYRRMKDYIFITLDSYSGIIIPASSEYNLDEVKAELDKIFQ